MTRQTQNTIVGGVAGLVVLAALLVMVRSFDVEEGASGNPTEVRVEGPQFTAPPPVGADLSSSAPSAAVNGSAIVVEVPSTAGPAAGEEAAAEAAAEATPSVPASTIPPNSTTTSTERTPSTTAGSSGRDEKRPPPTEQGDETDPNDSGGSSKRTDSAGSLSEIEREIVRLTNELRVNPTGPLKRQKPVTGSTCGEFHNVSIKKGTHAPVEPLLLDEVVSVHLARDWSFQMGVAGEMTHRPNESTRARYAELDVEYQATGENVAWASGYDEDVIAQTFFEGWRESDGHYCSMVSPIFTHLGVGHVQSEGTDWGTQNFYNVPR